MAVPTNGIMSCTTLKVKENDWSASRIGEFRRERFQSAVTGGVSLTFCSLSLFPSSPFNILLCFSYSYTLDIIALLDTSVRRVCVERPCLDLPVTLAAFWEITFGTWETIHISILRHILSWMEIPSGISQFEIDDNTVLRRLTGPKRCLIKEAGCQKRNYRVAKTRVQWSPTEWCMSSCCWGMSIELIGVLQIRKGLETKSET
jgi:hypothetical protein